MSVRPSTVACIPISVPSPTRVPWTTALCPTVTPAPMTLGCPVSQWTVALSCTFVPGPMATSATSPRTAAPYQTLTPGPSDTRPITRAVSARYTSSRRRRVMAGPKCGGTP